MPYIEKLKIYNQNNWKRLYFNYYWQSCKFFGWRERIRM